MALSFIIFGFCIEPFETILKGMFNIIVTSDILITDYFVIGGRGSAFVNSGLLMFFSITIMYFLKVEIKGISVASVFLMGSFALFGKNIVNVWFIIVGLIFYTKNNNIKLKEYIHIGFLATSIAPIFTEILFIIELGLWFKILLSVMVSVSIGYIIIPLSKHMYTIHKGFNLYHTGFVVGILGSIYISVFKAFGYKAEGKLIWNNDNSMETNIFLITVFVVTFFWGVFYKKQGFRKFGQIFLYSGHNCDFIISEGFGNTLKNMSINGVIGMLYVVLIGGSLNGPTIAGIITVMGFGAMGKHFKNIIPIFLGVVLGSFIGMYDLRDPVILLSALFGTALSPISGEYGWFWGMLAGILNSAVVVHLGILHGGMNLYNTGFSAGIVAAFMIPLLELKKKK